MSEFDDEPHPEVPQKTQTKWVSRKCIVRASAGETHVVFLSCLRYEIIRDDLRELLGEAVLNGLC